MLPALVSSLKSDDDQTKRDALTQLAQLMDSSYGEDAATLCEYLRVSGCVGLLSAALAHADPQIHQTAMLLVGNIASEAVDKAAEKTKALAGLEKEQARRDEDADHEQAMRHESARRDAELAHLNAKHEAEAKRHGALKGLGVDLTKYLVALAAAKPDQHLRIDSAAAPAVHVHP